jgi:hypothetical protein
LEFFSSPNTVYKLSEFLFGAPAGYDALLAVEEAGAHVEYLYQRGNLKIANLEELGNTKTHLPLIYQATQVH